MHKNVFTLPAVSFTAGSYTEDEANFPQENNLISQKIKVSSVGKVILRTFKTSSWEKCLFNIFPLFFIYMCKHVTFVLYFVTLNLIY